MINVTYHRKYHKLTVKGHAEYAEEGKDIICAAASILFNTLGSNLEDDALIRDYKAKTDKGDSEIVVTPNSRMEHIVTLIFDTICRGYDLLALKYPEYIKFEIFE